MGGGHPRITRSGALRCAAAAVFVMLALAAVAPAGVGAAGPIVPDSSCADEKSYKSLQGDHAAALQVINKSPETVKVWWLDYTGKRVLYQELPPFTMYTQRTWLTHPWVISNVAGQCYRFLVMTSQLQSVTVEGEPPDPDTTALPLSARASAAPTPAPTPVPTPVPTVAPTAASTTVAATTPPVPTSASAATLAPTVPTGGGSDNTGALIGVAVAAAAVITGAALAATGRLPGLRGRGPRPGP